MSSTYLSHQHSQALWVLNDCQCSSDWKQDSCLDPFNPCDNLIHAVDIAILCSEMARSLMVVKKYALHNISQMVRYCEIERLRCNPIWVWAYPIIPRIRGLSSGTTQHRWNWLYQHGWHLGCADRCYTSLIKQDQHEDAISNQGTVWLIMRGVDFDLSARKLTAVGQNWKRNDGHRLLLLHP